MSHKKDLRQLQREAEKNGWTIVKTKNCHLKWTKGDVMFFTATTPSDHRAIHNIESFIKRGDKQERKANV